jgi:hypothetical protein
VIKMAWYSYPNETSAGTADKLFLKYPDAILNGYFGYGFILGIFLLTFVASLASGSKKALAVAGFTSLFFSVILFRILDLNPVVYFVLLVLTIIGLIGAKEDQL